MKASRGEQVARAATAAAFLVSILFNVLDGRTDVWIGVRATVAAVFSAAMLTWVFLFLRRRRDRS